MRRPCEDPAIPCRAPCKNPAAPQEEEEAPRRRGLPVTPRNPQEEEEEAPSPSRRPKRRPPADGSPARSVQIASGGHRSGALAVGAAVLADAAVSALLQILFTSGTETHLFFFIRIAAPARAHRGGLMAGHADACQRDALASPSEGCGRQRATACTSSRRHRRRFRRRGRRRRRSPSILSSHPIRI